MAPHSDSAEPEFCPSAMAPAWFALPKDSLSLLNSIEAEFDSDFNHFPSLPAKSYFLDDKEDRNKALDSFLMRLSTGEIVADFILLSRIQAYVKLKLSPFDESFISLDDFMKKWFENYFSVNLGRNFDFNVNLLKNKYEEMAVRIAANLSNLSTDERIGFELAYNTWITEPEKKFDLSLDYEELSKFLQTSTPVVEAVHAENMFLSGIYSYLLENKKYPNDDESTMVDFAKRFFGNEVDVDKIKRISLGLKRKYKEKLGNMLKNVGISSPLVHEAFTMATKIWKFKISK